MFDRVFMVAMYRHFDNKDSKKDTVKKVICMGAHRFLSKWKGATQKSTDYTESWEIPKGDPLFICKFMASDCFRNDTDLEKECMVYFTVRSPFKFGCASYLLKKVKKSWGVYDCIHENFFFSSFLKKPEDALKNALNRQGVTQTKKELNNEKEKEKFYTDFLRGIQLWG